jgi:transcriptional regulator with XRE-family HTH domain
MAIYLHEKLKQFRKARDLTQEQVADVFNVASQTVSRWETGTNCPDIEMLPALADFFEVTVDDLLGVDIAKKEERIIEIHNEQNEAMNNESVDSQIKILRKGLKEFPNHYALLYRLAGALWGKAWHLKEAGNKDEMKKYAEEAIKTFEQVISNYSYDGNRYSSMPILEQKYRYNYATVHYGAIHGTACAYKYFLNDTEKAVEFANKLPAMNNTREFVLSKILEDERKPKEEQYDFTKEYEQLKSVVAELEKYVKKDSE